ncbi:hypothetical protein GOP47_0026903 [Adiantum capillus-veneris]|nr:hypothetical protein GOP47_0026903 [Adiantum capillus-veneris]
MLRLLSCHDQELLAQASVEDLVCMLRKCKTERAPSLARWLHAHILKRGLLDTCASIGNYLVLVYVELGLIHDAQLVFAQFRHLMNASSCSFLISAHARSGNPKLALSLHHNRNKTDSAYPYSRTYVDLLKACSKLKDQESGANIHIDLLRQGVLNKDIFVGSALVDMYAKCSNFVEARKVLEALSAPNVFTWNALITGYVRYGHCEEALKCVSQMQLAGVTPDIVTYVCVLKACGVVGAIDKGEELYDDICKRALLGENVILGSTLVDMFARCGHVGKAQQIFDKLLLQDVVSWTALIAGYVEYGQSEKALSFFEQMQLEGVCPDSVTFLCSLKACGNIRDVNKGCGLHHEIEAKGILEEDIALGSMLVDMYAKCRLMSRARRVFDMFGSRNIVLWNALIAGYANLGHGEEALKCFEQMKLEGVYPDRVTYSCALKSCCLVGATHKGTEIHADIARKDLCEDDLVVGSTLIDLYAKCGLLNKAQQVFNDLAVRDVICWTTLIAGYGEHGHSEKALFCFEKMQAEGVLPNALTFVYSLKACGETGAIDKCQAIHAEVERKGLLDADVLLGSTLIEMYAKCGLLIRAQQVFDKLPLRDVASWTPLITGYAQIGECKYVFKILEEMISDGIKPDSITFVTVLNACSRACLSHESQSYFEAMTRDYGIPPSLEHHSCMVDLLGRAGQLSKAVDTIKKMQYIPNLPIWLTVLAACQTLGDKNLGKQAFKNALHLDDDDASAYVFMSRLHAES